MAIQIIMDHSGDTRHEFRTDDVQALLEAEQRFYELVSAGYTAASRNEIGDPVVTRKFDPSREQTLFFPRIVGG